ncbi:hypothetical protein [Actinomadura sp. DC4]|uniref:hypothetical protein n=1 Tax=Actinomadura sp. DC4 TaxID=3055069 RepID=UPI0025B0E7EF|nr:hypothetical protein [Actinomadura sp. DC4]MDN3354597.1 hypothetical protein [Actinomadura sp. DC4]
MRPRIEQREHARVGHRIRFWARPGTANTVSRRYKTQDWLVERPEDGEPAVQRTVRCETCKKLLTYRVHNVEDTLRRYGRRRTGVFVGLALLFAGMFGRLLMLVTGDSLVGAILALGAISVGALASWSCGLMSGEGGVTGHLNGWPGATRHAVFVDRGEPELVCPKCGHQEALPPSGPDYPENMPRKRYLAAKARLGAHECTAP